MLNLQNTDPINPHFRNFKISLKTGKPAILFTYFDYQYLIATEYSHQQDEKKISIQKNPDPGY